ncbi:MAG: S8 family serine peptidase [Gaiellaceae bacterium]
MVAAALGVAALAAVPAGAAVRAGHTPAPELALRRPPRQARVDPNAVLVKFRAGVSAATRRAVADAHAGQLQQTDTATGTSLVAVDDPEEAKKAFDADPRVEHVELNHIRYALATPNDARFGSDQQYLLPLRLQQAWDVSRGSTAVKIAILDTGVDLDHPDLAPHIVPGYDFENNDADPQDDEGHGTMVAGIAAAVTDNGIGIAGAAWNASILPVKVLDATGSGSDFRIANGITWAADNGAQVINMSLGGPGSSQTLYDAIEYARKKGAVVVAAAGNDGAPLLSVPGAYADAAVGATDASGDAAWFSTSGYWVDLSAPGIDITSTALAPGPVEAYAKGAGTSFASPIVAGVAALVRAQHPDWAQVDVVKQVLRGWDRGPRGLDPFYGLGLVDAAAATGSAQQAPAAQPAGDANEPNGGPIRATSVTTSASGTISPEGDQDDFGVNVAAPKWFSFTVTPQSLGPAVRASEVDPVLSVLGPKGERLASSSENTPGRREATLVPAATAGRYYAEVSSQASARGSYSVAVSDVAPPAVFDGERGRSFPDVSFFHDLTLADLTGDGRKDVVSAGTNKLMLLPQLASGGFGEPQWLPIDQGWSFGSGSGDLDGDGAVDVAVATMAGPQVFSARDGALAAGPLLAQPTPVRGLQVADVDGDSRSDVVTAGDNGSIRIFHNGGRGTFTATVVTSAPHYHVAVGDLTGDGRLDLASCAGGTIDVFVQGGANTFTKRSYDYRCGDDLVAADLNGDGRTDLASNAYQTQVFAQTSGGTLAAPDTFSGLSEGYLAAGDLNADGRTDLVEIAHHSCYFRQLSQLANGLLALATNDCRANYWDGPLAIGDVTGDGKADVVLAQNGGVVVTFPHAASDAPRPAEAAEFWDEDTRPPDFALDVPVTTEPVIDFGNDPAMHSAASLVSGLTGREAPTAPAFDHSTLSTTVRPATGLAPGTPYVLAQAPQYYSAESPRLSGAAFSWRFATAGAPNTTVPDTTMFGDPDRWTSKANAVFTFTASKTGSMFECSLDGATFYPCTSPRTYDGLPAGPHTFRARAIDAGGRTDPTPATIAWTVPAAPARAPVDQAAAAAAASPANDNFANRQALSGSTGTIYASNVGATSEAGEPDSQYYPQPMSIWYRWTAPKSGLFSFDVNGSSTGRDFELYTGSALTSLAPAGVKVGTGRAGQIYLVASAGVSYVIRLNDQYNPGPWALNWSDGVAPAVADTTPPEGNPTLASTPTPGWSSDNTIDVRWSGASDSGSGVDGFSYEWSQSATTVPDAVKDAEETATGTTSPALADGQWWFHLRTGDNAGNWSGPVHLGPFSIDTTAPANPALSSPSHAVGAWSSDATVDAAWAGAGDTGSGVGGFSYEWSQSATTVPDSTKDTGGSSTTSTPLADGSWWLHLRTVDVAGNWSAAVHLGPFRIDTAAPANPVLSTTHPTDWTSDRTVDASWAGAADPASGVSGYSVEWSQAALTAPDVVQDTTGTTATSPTLTDGSWWFHLRTRDAVGNWSTPVHLGPLKIDGSAPTNPSVSSPSHTVDAWSNDPTVDIAWSGAGDPLSGVDGFSYAWSQQAATDPGTAKNVEEGVTGTTSDPLADGSWWFHLRTRDNAGNWSAPVHLGPFKIDVTPPTNPTLSTPSHTVGAWSANPDVVVRWSSSETVNGYSYEWSEAALTVPDTTRETDGATTTLTSARPDGVWWFHLRSLNGAGSWSDPSHIGPFRIDTRPPESTIGTSPPAETADRSATFSFSADEPATFACSLDGGDFGACASPVTYAALALGPHAFRVAARDRAGNVEPAAAERRWTISDATPPPPPPPPPEPPAPPLPPPPPPEPPPPPDPPPPLEPPPAPPAPPPTVTKPKPKAAPKKVTLCHRGRTIKVAKSQVRKHRRHGDKLGRCRRVRRR